MRIQQLFYTSCKKGISSGAGFQTYSMSKGISDDERKEIESHCVYIPLNNLPTQPTEEEIEKIFPLSFSYFVLKNGKKCVCQAKYIGKDYSGRYGNYFCHVLMFNEDYKFYPIELYKSKTFKDNLTYEEENATQIEYLKELEDIETGKIINFDSISKFLKNLMIKKRNENFKQLMESSINFNKSKKKIIFCDNKENIPYLIGAVQLALPKKLANQITFTTYSYNPENVEYMICASCKDGSKFDFQGNLSSYKYEVFNFIDVNNTNSNNNSKFVKLAEIGYTVSKAVFLPFREFLSQFEYNTLDRNVDNCVCLYNMVKKGTNKSDIDSVKKAVIFANDYKSMEAYTQLFHELKPNLEKISNQVDTELTEIITKFLLKMAKETGKNEYTENAYEFLFNSIDFLVKDAENIDLSKVLEVYENIRNININDFIKKSLKKSRIQELIIYIEGGTLRHANFYFKSILWDLMIFNKKFSNFNILLFNRRTENNKYITRFLEKCLDIIITSEEDIKNILYDLKNEYGYLSIMMVKLYVKYSRTQIYLKQTLIDFIVECSNESKTWKDNVYSSISEETNGNNLLINIYKFELSVNCNNEEFFICYCKDVFQIHKKFRREKFSEALNLYLNVFTDELCNNTTSLENCKKILNYIIDNSIEKYVDITVMKKFLNIFETKIHPKELNMDEFTIEKIFKMKDSYKIKTTCSVIELLYIGKKLEANAIKETLRILSKIKFKFEDLGEEKYKSYLQWFFPNICVYLKDYIEHEDIKKSLFCIEYEDIYYEEYIGVLKEIVLGKKYKSYLKDVEREGHEILLDFIICIFKNTSSKKSVLDESFSEGVISILKEVSQKKLNIYSEYIMLKVKSFENKEEINIKWRDILRRNSKEEKGIFLKIKQSFSK